MAEKLSDYQAKWLEKTGGVAIDMDKAEAIQKARSEKLTELIDGELQVSKAQILGAQSMEITKESDKVTFFAKVFGDGKGKSVTTKWKAEDDQLNPKTWETRADVEVDSRADLVDVLEPNEDDRRALIEALDRIMSIQTQMLNEFDDEGNRLFSDDDIRRELWTPLVRENTIPENMVPSKFSEQAQAFAGAAEIYQDRIDEYSKNSTGHEDALRVLSIATKSVSLAGTLASGAVTMSGAVGIAEAKEQIATGKDASGNALSDTDLADLKAQKALLEQRNAVANFAVTSLSGGFELLEAGAQQAAQGEDADWASFADKTFKVFASVVAAGVGPIAAEIIGPVEASTTDEGKARMSVANAVKGGILGGISGLRMGTTLVAALKDGKKGTQIAQAMIEQFADGVQHSFVAASNMAPDKAEAAELRNLGAALRSSILALSSAPDAIRLAREGKYKEAALKLGGGVLLSGASIASTFIGDAVTRDVDASTAADASFAERQYMDATTDDADPTQNLGKQQLTELNEAKRAEKFQAEVAKQLSSMEAKIIADFDENSEVTVDPGAVKFAEEMQAKVSAEQQAMAEKEMSDFFGDRANVDAIFDDVEAKLKGYEDMYDAAVPDPQIEGKPPGDVEKAMKAIDQAMAQTAQLRARAEMINSITSAGASILAAAVPGTGAVVVAQKLAYDIFLLTQAVTMHNKWVESMEIAFRAYSGYGAGIEKTLENAKVTLDHSKVKVALDVLKLGAEVGRCFDPTGGATIASTALTMTSALVEYGYDMHKEREIDAGWAAYKRAREDPANRKAARKALRMNSTLAKCCIAYGACIAKDPAAQEAIRISGLSPSILANDKDVCKRLVTYLENEMNDDPVVMHVERQPKKWQSGKPVLTPGSWFEIKSAAVVSAEPRLDAKSAKTPGIDSLLAKLADKDHLEGYATYQQWRVAKMPDGVQALARKPRAQAIVKILSDLQSQFDSYKPMQANSADAHADMGDLADTFKALCTLNMRVAQPDADWVMPPAPPPPSSPPPPVPDSPVVEDMDEDDVEQIQTRARAGTI
ncbi:MAG: hypothetical protein ABJL99_03880 [Aliishimia sp.]